MIRENILKQIDSSNFEDIEREIEIVLYHLARCENKDEEFENIISKLQIGVPIVNQLGYTVWENIKIRINNSVLTPGMETFILLQHIKKHIQMNSVECVLDLCTGSGVFAIIINSYLSCRIFASDISDEALVLAKDNSHFNKCNITFIKSDMFRDSIFKDLKFDIIVSNPPYVKTAEINSLPSFVKDYAPLIAIDGGCDGLKFHEIILSESHKYLNDKGVLFLECEDYQFPNLQPIIIEKSWSILETYNNKKNEIRGLKLQKT